MANGLGFLAVALLLSACSSMRSDIAIRARPERVWSVLTELERYPEWNPFFVQAKGKLLPDETLELEMQPVGKSRQTFHPTVRAVEPGKLLRWRGRLFMPGLFDGTHELRIEVLNDEWVRFVQYEEFSGMFVPFVGFGPYREGWERMNRAIKARAESAPSPTAR